MKTEDKPVRLTDHAKRRGRSRLHLNEQELQLIATSAWKDGTRTPSGRIAFAGFFWIFMEKDNCHLLITVNKGYTKKGGLKR